MNPVEFAARRLEHQDAAIQRLLPTVEAWIEDIENADRLADLFSALNDLYREVYQQEGGTETPDLEALENGLAPGLEATTDESDARTVATWMSTYVMNAATGEAIGESGGALGLEWVTMLDGDVRPTHAAVHGQRRNVGETFTVGGEELLYPGQPVGDPAVWINCRCVLAPVAQEEVRASGVSMGQNEAEPTQGEVMADEETPVQRTRVVRSPVPGPTPRRRTRSSAPPPCTASPRSLASCWPTTTSSASASTCAACAIRG